MDADGSGDTPKEEPTVPAFEVQHPYGLISRPRDPDVDANGKNPVGCTVLYGWEGDRGHAWFMSDPRVARRLPLNVEPGGTMLFSHRDDGQLSILRLRGTDGGFSVFVPGKNGTKQGSYISIDSEDEIDLSSPWSRAQVGKNGLILSHISGASISMGSIGGLPSPLDALTSFVDIAAAAVSISASVVNIGTDGGAASQTAIEALILFLNAFVAKVATITTVTPGATAMADPAFVTLLEGLQLALAPIGKIV